MVSSPVPLQISDHAYEFYWGKIQTFREDQAGFADRVESELSRAREDGALLTDREEFANGGVLFVRQEELGTPFDPNASEIVGLRHVGGLTFVYRKRTLNRLRTLAMARTKEILGTATVRDRTGPAAGFCVMGGMISLPRVLGWHESVKIAGRFQDNGYDYDFLLSVRAAQPEGKKRTYDLDDRRGVVLAITAGTGISDAVARQVQLPKPHRFLYIDRRGNRPLPVYEWQGTYRCEGLTPHQDLAVLHVWPAAAGKEAEHHLVRMAKSRLGQRPAFLDIQPLNCAGQEREGPQVVAEESKMPWAQRLLDMQTRAPLAGRPYLLKQEGKVVFEGRTDQSGFTFTQNTDYFEHWTVEVRD